MEKSNDLQCSARDIAKSLHSCSSHLSSEMRAAPSAFKSFCIFGYQYCMPPGMNSRGSPRDIPSQKLQIVFEHL